MNCPSCGADNTSNANFCSNCGATLTEAPGDGAAQDQPCRNCGVPVPVGSEFCGNCGATAPHDASAGPSLRDQLAAGASKRDEDVTVPRGRVDPKTGEVLRDVTEPGDSAGPKRPVGLAASPKSEEARTVEMTSNELAKPRVGPPPKPSSPVSVPDGWPDVTEDVAEVRFFLLQGLDEEAKVALAKLEDRFPGHPDLENLNLEQDLADGKAAAPKPEQPAEASVKATKPPAKPAAKPATTSAAKPAKTVVRPLPKVGAKVGAEAAKPAVAAPVPVAKLAEQSGKTVVKARKPQAEPVPVVPTADPQTDPLGETVARPKPTAPGPEEEPGSWGDVPAPGSTVIARAPKSPDEPDAEPAPKTASSKPSEEVAQPAEVVASGEVPTPKDKSPRPPRSDQTIVTQGLQQPTPFDGAGQWLEGNAMDLIATPGRPAGPKTTMVSHDPERPAPPAPFGGEAPPGSTMVPGTTPPVGGFATIDRPPGADEFEERLPLAARGPQADEDEGGDTSVETERTDGVPEAVGKAGAAASAVPAPAPDREPSEEGTPEATEAATSMTSEGTVITYNPLPPAPFEGDSPKPIEAARLVMLGSRGQPVAERSLTPGDTLLIGRDLSEPWGDDEYLEQEHARISPAPGGGVKVDDFGGKGPVYRQVEHRRAVRPADQFRVGQSLVTYLDDDDGPRLTVQINNGGAPAAYPLGPNGLLLGREDGDVVFPDDTYVSSAHCKFSREGGGLFVEDLGSSNGTYVRVRSDETVEYGALLLVGHTQFRIQALPA